jgi:urease accessory protein
MFETTHQRNPGEDFSRPGAFGEHGGNVRDVDLERANGVGRIMLTGSEKGTRIADVYQKFPIGIVFPRIGDDLAKEAVVTGCGKDLQGAGSTRAGFNKVESVRHGKARLAPARNNRL